MGPIANVVINAIESEVLGIGPTAASIPIRNVVPASRLLRDPGAAFTAIRIAALLLGVCERFFETSCERIPKGMAAPCV
jgi:hypothetical protein